MNITIFLQLTNILKHCKKTLKIKRHRAKFLGTNQHPIPMYLMKVSFTRMHTTICTGDKVRLLDIQGFMPEFYLGQLFLIKDKIKVEVNISLKQVCLCQETVTITQRVRIMMHQISLLSKLVAMNSVFGLRQIINGVIIAKREKNLKKSPPSKVSKGLIKNTSTINRGITDVSI